MQMDRDQLATIEPKSNTLSGQFSFPPHLTCIGAVRPGAAARGADGPRPAGGGGALHQGADQEHGGGGVPYTPARAGGELQGRGESARIRGQVWRKGARGVRGGGMRAELFEGAGQEHRGGGVPHTPAREGGEQGGSAAGRGRGVAG